MGPNKYFCFLDNFFATLRKTSYIGIISSSPPDLIPDICHFFTLTHFESWKFYTRKVRKFTTYLPKTVIFSFFLEFFYTPPKNLHSRRSWRPWQISGIVMVFKIQSWGGYLQVLRTQSRGGLADEDDVQENFEGWSKHRSSRQGGCQSIWSWSSDRKL